MQFNQKLDSFRSEIALIMKGEKTPLKNKHLIQFLPELTAYFFAQKKDGSAKIIITSLGNGLLTEEPEIRTEISEALAKIGENLIADQHLMIMLNLSHKLANWLKLENSLTSAYEKICIQLQALAQTLILKNQFAKCSHILDTFNAIHKGILPKDGAIQLFAGNTLEGIATPSVLKLLMDDINTEEKSRAAAFSRLTQLGVGAAAPLLILLKESRDRYERIRILRAISDIGHVAIPAVIEQIRQESPWYYIRNLLLLFGKIGNEIHVPILGPFLEYKDIRVQREALNGIYHIGGKEGEEIILSILPLADDRLKPDIVDILGELRSYDAVPFLLYLLEFSLAADSEMGNHLAEKICTALGKIGDEDAIPILSQLLEPSSRISQEIKDWDQDETIEHQKNDYNENIKAAAASALAMIRGNQEKYIDEVDSMTLKEIKKSGKMLRSDDQEHMNIWSALYNTLTSEEADALYSVLKEGTCHMDCLIYKQGESNIRLYFIEQGEAVLAYDQEGEEIWIKTLKPGYIAGSESFFTNSFTTTSLISASDARIKFLKKEELVKLEKTFPELKTKLKNFCLGFENEVHQILNEYGMERRSDERISVSGKVLAQAVDELGNSDGRGFKGEFLDISAGGLSFQVRMPKQNAHQLLSHRLRIKFLLIGEKSKKEIEQDGTVVAVRDKSVGIYSVHVKFDKMFSQFFLITLGEFKIGGIPENALIVKKDDFLVTTW